MVSDSLLDPDSSVISEMVKVFWDQKVWEWLLQWGVKVSEGDGHCIEALGHDIIQSTCPSNNHSIL